MRGLLVLLLLSAGCRQIFGFQDPIVQPDDGAPPMDVPGDVSPIECSNDSDDCPVTAPFCVGGLCVECTADNTTACPPSEPFCGLDNLCRGCVSNADCDSELCLANGSCADGSEVAYVASQGAGVLCTRSAPCATLQLGFDRGLPYIKVSGEVTDTQSANLNRAIEIYGDAGGAITRSTNGQLIDVNNGAAVGLFGIILKDAKSSAGTCLRLNNGSALIEASLIANCEGVGIDARQNTTLTLRRSIVFSNAGGGVDLDNAAFSITNSIIVQNGSLASSIGGVRIKPRTGASTTFELVTVADNAAAPGEPSGIRCDDPFGAHSSIVTGNTVDPACTFESSLFDVATPGAGNRTGEPKFSSTTVPTALDFYRIQNDESAAIDGATSTILFDVDGGPRPVGLAPDMGADEVAP